MNNHRNQQKPNWIYGNQQDNRSQQQGNRSQYEKQTLERDLRSLERDLAGLDAQIDTLGEKGRLLEAEKRAHMQSVPFAIAQVALSTLGLRYLPPVARTWQYRSQLLQRSEEQLKHYAFSLSTRRNVLIAQIEQIIIQIDMLKYHP